MTEPDELLLELEKVQDTVVQARMFVAGHDQADAARNGLAEIRYSALRTALQHAESTLERVMVRLRGFAERAANTPPSDGPPNGRDAGPI